MTELQDSDDEIHNPKAHKKLLEGIDRISKIQRIKKPTRNECAVVKSSEFHLVKGKNDGNEEFYDDEKIKKRKNNRVSATDLSRVLQKTTNHLQIGKELNKARRTNKTLLKPLERHEADKIQRSIGYDNTKKSLKRWDAIVAKNRAADQLQFPLVHEDVKIINSKPREAFSYRIKPDWMAELEALTPKEDKEEIEVDAIKEFPLTLEELREKRKELARLRVKESYRIDKARRMNKIKSKKYHRILKREKLKAQIKEFEELQKTDPEAALKQLQIIDKTRIEERANLRHKNTGTWAKNLQIRAKYDKDVRKELAQQLAISRELTQKHTMEEDTTDEETEMEVKDNHVNVDPMNPWSKNPENENEVLNFVSGYKKYWQERNVNTKKMVEYLKDDDNNTEPASQTNEEENVVSDDEEKDEKSFINNSGVWTVEEDDSYLEHMEEGSASDSNEEESAGTDDDASDEALLKVYKEKFKNKSIDEIFNKAEDRLDSDIDAKLKAIRNNLENKRNKGKSATREMVKNKDKEGYKSGLEFPTVALRPDLDEELIETSNSEVVDSNKSFSLAKTPTNIPDVVQDQIDPTKFVQVKPKFIRANISQAMAIHEDAIDDDEDAENAEKQLTIAEAFEEDDILADFIRDKEDERNKDAVEDINQTLPGWGSWTGTGVPTQVPRNKRFIVKMPKVFPRRDDNKQNVIINETANSKIKRHMVSQLPFPFTTVKDYEASIRAPIGASFVPETASRVLTQPMIETKLGTIIEPMNEKMLLKQKMDGGGQFENKGSKKKQKKKSL